MVSDVEAILHHLGLGVLDFEATHILEGSLVLVLDGIFVFVIFLDGGEVVGGFCLGGVVLRKGGGGMDGGYISLLDASLLV